MKQSLVQDLLRQFPFATSMIIPDMLHLVNKNPSDLLNDEKIYDELKFKYSIIKKGRELRQRPGTQTQTP